MSTARAHYAGPCRKLVLAFDVGTSHSGISYSILNPGQVPEIKGVTKFPGQHQVSGSSKIPSIVSYDFSGNAQAMGAEAIQDETASEAEERIIARWFKLHLRPKSNSTKDIHFQHPPLPPGKTVIDVLADFLRYLFQCTRTYIEETHPNGVDLWLSVENEVEFVLSHPNGWESQQGRMRKAAVLAGLIPDDQSGQDRVTLITEGKAGLQFSIRNGLPPGALEKTDGVIVVDAGGLTVNISAYAPDPNMPTSFNEIAAPQRHYHGSIFVSRHARYFLAKFLAESMFLDDLDNIIDCFDRTTKLHFRNSEKPQIIKFAGVRDNDPEFNILRGHLKLTGAKVAEFFEPCITCIVESVRAWCKTGNETFSNVMLVGGFAVSDWLYTKVAERLAPEGLTVIRPNGHVNKAVADGALSDYIDHHPDMLTTPAPCDATLRKLVLAFDVGTTYSGVSYCILEPGQVPKVRGVARFPGHDQVVESSKIPTIVYYDTSGKAQVMGAEAMREGIYETAEDENWIKAEWFKLHLRPESDSAPSFRRELPPLPPGKSVTDILADFLRYLFHCTQIYIEETYQSDANLWPSVVNDIDFVLSHPNGWGVAQQTQMREAVVLAGLVPDDQRGWDQVSFITEGEASLHFAIRNGLSPGALVKSENVMIVDAGGGTIDISCFACSTDIPTSFYEIAPPQCYICGSIFVNIHARLFLDAFLSKSPFFEDLDHIIRCFDKTTKLRFRNPEEPQLIKFGSLRDNDPGCDIHFGHLKLKGDVVAKFFEPSIQCVVKAVHEQHEVGRKTFSNVILVGGFAANDWLYTQVVERLNSDGFTVIRPENHVNKAVADGALLHYIDHRPSLSTMHAPYYATCRKLVMAFNIGTTHSSISYCILDPGQVPEIKGVTKFPGEVSESWKVPTIIYYDTSGKARAMGAEAFLEDNYETAEEEGWVKVEWFKLLLSPTNMIGELPSLPHGKTVVDVLADFLGYLFKCARTYIEETHTNGVDLWPSFKEDIDFVLSYPNGWEGQQTQIRSAAVLAGLIADHQSGQDRIAFVPEAEASLYFSIHDGLLSSVLEEGDDVIMVDAGGGTIYIGPYTRNANITISSTNVAPQCHLHGSVFVSIYARSFLEKLLSGSAFLDDLDDIVHCFDQTTKLRFRNSEEAQLIKFGSKHDNQPDLDILHGQLKLTGAKVAEFFEPSVTCIVEAVRAQRKKGHKELTSVIMVGGFAASDWLYNKVTERLKPDGFTVIRPDSHTNKTVAEGVLSYYINHIIKSTARGPHSATAKVQTGATVLPGNRETEEARQDPKVEQSRPLRSSLIRVPSDATRRKLVVAFDVGTTYSGISFCILDPGKVPEVRHVTRFPVQDRVGEFSKIPTVIYYDAHGKVRAVGAETGEEVLETAYDEGWEKAEWFKLHLRSDSHLTNDIPPLPPGKSVIDILADFLRYLFHCTLIYIEETYPSDANLWPSLVSDIDFVLSHPNGWGGAEQLKMWKAAVLAGLVPDSQDGHDRISFVTEGEASLHFAIRNGLPPSVFMESEGVTIVDAGGGTIDISDFACNADVPTFYEITRPQCHFYGSIFVSLHAHKFLEALLSGSTFFDDLDYITHCFDRTTKLRFRNAEEPQYIRFGSTRDNDTDCNIRFGQLKLKGEVVARFFEPSIQWIIEALYALRGSGQKLTTNVVLVGGFAASDWLYTQLVERLKPDGVTVIRPNNYVNKAVADGALFYYIQQFSTASTLGAPQSNTWDGETEEAQRSPDHRQSVWHRISAGTRKVAERLKPKDFKGVRSRNH